MPGAYAGETSGGSQGVPNDLEEIQGKLDEISNKLDCVAPCPEQGECPGAVPKTGQTTSHGDRDDGELERGTRPNPRFTDNLDGTITDNLTCLIWDKDANRFGQRTWADALSDCNGLADNDGDLDDDSIAGDWGLANRFELESLLHLGVFTPAVPDTLGTGQWSQGDPFNNVQSSFYWSSTTLANFTTNAWFVSFNVGSVGNDSKSSSKHVWCVRGGP